MLKILGATAAVGVVVVLGVLLWMSRTGFMSEGRGFGAAVGLDNQTGLSLRIEALADGDEWITVVSEVDSRPGIGSIPAGAWYGQHSRTGRDGCSTVPLRAVDSAGREIDRHPPPLCDGETWVIQAP